MAPKKQPAANPKKRKAEAISANAVDTMIIDTSSQKAK